MISFKKVTKKCIAVLLTIPLIMSNISIAHAATDVDISITTTPKVDVILATGRFDKTNINMSNFDTDLKNSLASMGVNTSNVKITKIETSEVNVANSFTWNTTSYFDRNIGSISTSTDGKNVTMIGNPVKLGKNAIFAMPTIDSQQKFSYNYSIEFGDSFNAAGMILRVKDENNILSGYMLSFNNSTWTSNAGNQNGAIWKFSFPKGSNGSNMTKTLVRGLSISKAGTLNITTDSKYITVSGGGLAAPVTVNVDAGYGSGFGFFSDHYSHGCDSIGSFNLTGIGLQETNSKNFSDVLKIPEWRDGTIRVLVNANDYVEDDFSNPSKLGEILSRTINENMNYVAWGPSSTASSSNSFISQNSGKGKYIAVENAGNYANAILQTATYIKGLFPPATASQETVLVNTLLNINVYPQSLKTNTQNALFPNGRWYISHEPNYFENPIGPFATAGMFRPNLDFSTLDKTGKYEIKFEDKLIKTIIVHRKPTAAFTLRNTANNVALISSSYDLDKYSTNSGMGPGIAAEEWKYKESTATNWTNGKLTYATPGKTYVIQLRVKDLQGEWSDPVTKYVAGDASYVSPVADFNFDKSVVSKYGQVVVSDSSYDPKSAVINSYKWEVVFGNTRIYAGEKTSFFQPPVDFLTHGPGTYAYKLIVKNNAGFTSDAYTRFLTVVTDTNAPEIEINPSNSPWATGINVTAKMTDIDSKLLRFRYVFNTSGTPPTTDAGWNSWTNISGPSATHTLSPTTDGKLYLHMQVQDVAGNVGSTTRGIYNVDKTKPVINTHTFNGAFGALTTNKNTTVAVQFIEPLSGVNRIEYKLTGQANYTTLPVGDFDFIVTDPYMGPISVFAYDNVNNKSTEYIINNLIIDSAPPALNVPNTNPWYISNVVLPITATDANGIRSISYRTNESIPQSGTVVSGGNITLANEGQYVLTVIATDNAGNTTTVNRNINIDKTAPIVNSHSFVERPSKLRSLITNKQVDVTIAVTEALSGYSYMEYKLPGQTNYTRVNGKTFLVDKQLKGNISIYTYDIAGNKSTEYIIGDLVAETVPPSLTVQEPNAWYKTDAVLNVISTDENGIHSITYTTNEIVPQVGTVASGGNITLSNEGQYVLTVTSTDNAGNTTVVTKNINIDKTIPVVNSHSFVERPSKLRSLITNKQVDITIDATESLSGYSYMEYKLPGQTNYTRVDGKTFLVNNPLVGDISIYTYDIATNKSNEYIISDLIAEKVAPNLTVEDAPAWSTTPISLKATSSDEFGVAKIDYFTSELTPQTGTILNPANIEQIPVVNEGVYDLTVTATDNATNTTSVKKSIHIDLTAPVVESHRFVENIPLAKSRMANKVTNKTIDVYLDINELTSGFSYLEYKLPGDNAYTRSNTEGFYIQRAVKGDISIFVYDVAGNKSKEYIIPNLIIENVPPLLDVENPPTWSKTDVSLLVSSSDENGIKNIKYTTSEEIPQQGEVNDGERIVLSNEGIYQLSIESTDNAGNSTVVVKTVRIDKTKPVINMVHVNGEESLITNDAVRVDIDATDNLSTIKNYEYLLDGNDDYNVLRTGTYFMIKTLYNGSIEVIATDIAGNISDPFIVKSLIIEKTKPNLIVEELPFWANSDLMIHASVKDDYLIDNIQWTTNEKSPQYGKADFSGTGTILTKIGTGETIIVDLVSEDDGFHRFSFPMYNEGEYDLNIILTDKAGNRDEHSTGIKIDKTKPIIEDVLVEPIISHNRALVTNKSAKYTIKGTDNLSGIRNYEYKLDGQSWTAIADNSFTLFSAYHGNVFVRAIDFAGNVSDQFDCNELTIDLTPPTLEVTGTSLWSKNPIEFTAIAKDMFGVKSITYKTDEAVPQAGNVIKDKFVLKNAGTYNVTVTATDEAGNQISETRQVKIDLSTAFQAPKIDSNGYQNGSISSSDVTLRAYYDEEPYSGLKKIQYSFDNGASWTDGAPVITTETTLDRTYLFRGISNAGLESEISNPFRVKINKSVNISFESNGGTPISQIKMIAGTQLESIPTTTKLKMVFDGWYLDSQLTVAYTTNMTLIKDTTLYAKWIDKTVPTKDPDKNKPDTDKEYTLEYSANNGGYIDGDTKQEVFYGESGESVSAKADEGYVFLKWSDGYKNVTRKDTNIKKNIELTAEFEKIKEDNVPPITKNEVKPSIPEVVPPVKEETPSSKPQINEPKKETATESVTESNASIDLPEVNKTEIESITFKEKMRTHVGIPQVQKDARSILDSVKNTTKIISGEPTAEQIDNVVTEIEEYDANKNVAGNKIISFSKATFPFWILILILAISITTYIYIKKRKSK